MKDEFEEMAHYYQSENMELRELLREIYEIVDYYNEDPQFPGSFKEWLTKAKKILGEE